MFEFLFGAKPVQPATVPTDTIIPLHFLDDNKVNRSMVLDLTLRFDDVLDPEQLRNALARLMELGNWRKLGARLRMDDEGKLVYHVPVSFDKDRPGFMYSHANYDISIEDHPLASQLPKMTARPSTHSNPERFRPLARRADAPTTIDDYLYSDEPQLSMHIVSFEDATLVSLSWLHTLLDAMGRAALLNALTLVLSGREDEVPPLHGFDKDPLAPLGDPKPTETHALAHLQLTGLNMILFAIRYVFELLWWNKESSRLVCLPATHLQSLKQTALKDLGAEGDEKPFLSDGDVICAWWTRFVIQFMPRTSTRTVVIMNAFGLRQLLANDLLPAGTAFVSNAVVAVYAMLPAYEIFQRPLGFVASQIRRSIREQGTRPQIEAVAALARESRAKTGRPPVFGDSSAQLVIFSNWSKGRFFDVDLSAAVVRPGVPLEKRVNKLGRPSYVGVGTHATKFSTRYAFAILGKDAAGNYWFGGTMREAMWQKVEEEFAKL